MLHHGVPRPAPRHWSRPALLLSALALLLALAQSTSAQSVQAPSQQFQTTSYQGPLRPDPRLYAVEAAPVWRDRLDSSTALVTESAVVYLRDGRLVATELSSGWQQWAYGAGLTGPLLLAQGTVIVAEGAQVTALDAVAGTHLWSTEVTPLPVRYLDLSGEALLVGSGAEFALLELSSGNILHDLNVPGTSEPVHVDDGVVIFESYRGEPNVQRFHAFAPTTGKELWQSRGFTRLLGVEEGRAYLLNQRSASGGAGERFSLSVVDARTGVRLEHWSYGMSGAGPARPDGPGSQFVFTDDAIYIAGADGTVHRFARGGAEAPAASYQAPVGGTFLTGPHQGLLFFEGDDHSLVATKVGDLTTIRYLGAGTQTSRLDLVGRRAYVGRTGGTFLALDLGTARVRYMLSTDGVGFGPTLRSGAYLVVQGSSELFVLEALE